MSSPHLIGVTEAAEILGIPPRTVKRWILTGELAHVAKLPGSTGAYVLDLDTVQALAATRRAA